METEQCNPTRQKYINCNMERQEKGKGDYKSVIYQKCLEMCWKNKQTNKHYHQWKAGTCVYLRAPFMSLLCSCRSMF